MFKLTPGQALLVGIDGGSVARLARLQVSRVS
jgi:hypothetical protein